MLVVRHAIKPQPREHNDEAETKVSIGLPGSGIQGTTVTAIPFSAARAILRKGATKLLIAETVNPLSGNISQVKVNVENFARELKRIHLNTFGLLRCHGILKHREANQRLLLAVEMLFETPKESTRPTSLRQLLLQQAPVSASAVIKMAKQLVRSVSYIHKNIRPASSSPIQSHHWAQAFFSASTSSATQTFRPI